MTKRKYDSALGGSPGSSSGGLFNLHWSDPGQDQYGPRGQSSGNPGQAKTSDQSDGRQAMPLPRSGSQDGWELREKQPSSPNKGKEPAHPRAEPATHLNHFGRYIDAFTTGLEQLQKENANTSQAVVNYKGSQLVQKILREMPQTINSSAQPRTERDNRAGQPPTEPAAMRAASGPASANQSRATVRPSRNKLAMPSLAGEPPGTVTNSGIKVAGSVLVPRLHVKVQKRDMQVDGRFQSVEAVTACRKAGGSLVNMFAKVQGHCPGSYFVGVGQHARGQRALHMLLPKVIQHSSLKEKTALVMVFPQHPGPASRVYDRVLLRSCHDPADERLDMERAREMATNTVADGGDAMDMLPLEMRQNVLKHTARLYRENQLLRKSLAEKDRELENLRAQLATASQGQ